MPLSIPQVLDLLMAFIIVMFVPIGLWRGALREWMALGGIVLAGVLAGEWAGAGGDNFAAWASVDQRVARFAVGSLAFVGVTLLVGYGSGIALPYRPDLTWPNRFLGAALALGNGSLILSGVLRIMQRFLFDNATTSPLLTSTFANYSIASIGWTYLLLACLLIAVVFAGLRRRWSGLPALLDEFVPGDYDEEEPHWHASAPPGMVGVGERAYAEPDDDTSWQESRSAIGAAFAAQETDVLQLPWAAPPDSGGTEAPDDDADGAEDQPTPIPAPRLAPNVVTIVRPIRPASDRAGAKAHDLEDPTQPVTVAPLALGEAPREESHAEPATVGMSNATNGERGPDAANTCSVCGAELGVASRFCGACGHIRGVTERRAVRLRAPD